MKKTSIFIGLVIGIASSSLFVAANISLAPVPAFVTVGGVCKMICAQAVGAFTSTGVTQAQVISSGGTSYNVYRNNTCTLPAYFKP